MIPTASLNISTASSALPSAAASQHFTASTIRHYMVHTISVLVLLGVIACNMYFWNFYLLAFSWSVVISAFIRPAAIAWAAWAKHMRLQPKLESKHSLVEMALVLYPPFFLALLILLVLLPMEVSLVIVPLVGILAPLIWRLLLSWGLLSRVLGFVSDPGHMAAVLLWVSLLCAAWIIVAMCAASLIELAELALDASQVLSSHLELELELDRNNPTAAARGVAWMHERFGDTRWWPYVHAVLESIGAKDSYDGLLDRLSLVLRRNNGTEWEWFAEQAISMRKRQVMPPATEVMGKLSKLSSEVFTSLALLAWHVVSFAGQIFLQAYHLVGQGFATLFLLNKLVGHKQDLFSMICRTGLNPDEAEVLADRLRRGLSQTFYPLFSASRNALIVIVVYTILRRRCVFIAASLVFILGLTSLVPPKESLVVVALPWLLVPMARLALQQGQVSSYLIMEIVLGSILPFALMHASNLAHDASELINPVVSPWMMDFSVGVGISVFGFNGLLLGPSLVSVTVVLTEFFFDEPGGSGGSDTPPLAVPMLQTPPRMHSTGNWVAAGSPTPGAVPALSEARRRKVAM